MKGRCHVGVIFVLYKSRPRRLKSAVAASHNESTREAMEAVPKAITRHTQCDRQCSQQLPCPIRNWVGFEFLRYSELPAFQVFSSRNSSFIGGQVVVGPRSFYRQCLRACMPRFRGPCAIRHRKQSLTDNHSQCSEFNSA